MPERLGTASLDRDAAILKRRFPLAAGFFVFLLDEALFNVAPLEASHTHTHTAAIRVMCLFFFFFDKPRSWQPQAMGRKSV